MNNLVLHEAMEGLLLKIEERLYYRILKYNKNEYHEILHRLYDKTSIVHDTIITLYRHLNRRTYE